MKNDSICIVTGPVLTNALTTIGPNKVSVPKYYYKIILDCSPPEFKGIAFIIPNDASGLPLKNYAVSIDRVEIITGINFFPLLPDIQENKIEKSRCLSCWNWKKSEPVKKSANHKTNATTACCGGMTKAGNRCKKMTKSSTGKCFQHQ